MCWETFGIYNSFALLVVSKCLFIIAHLFVAFASLLLSFTSVCDNNSSQCKLIAVICNSWIFFMRKYSIHSIHVTIFRHTIPARESSCNLIHSIEFNQFRCNAAKCPMKYIPSVHIKKYGKVRLKFARASTLINEITNEFCDYVWMCVDF